MPEKAVDRHENDERYYGYDHSSWFDMESELVFQDDDFEPAIPG